MFFYFASCFVFFMHETNPGNLAPGLVATFYHVVEEMDAYEKVCFFKTEGDDCTWSVSRQVLGIHLRDEMFNDLESVISGVDLSRADVFADLHGLDSVYHRVLELLPSVKLVSLNHLGEMRLCFDYLAHSSAYTECDVMQNLLSLFSNLELLKESFDYDDSDSSWSSDDGLFEVLREERRRNIRSQIQYASSSCYGGDSIGHTPAYGSSTDWSDRFYYQRNFQSSASGD